MSDLSHLVALGISLCLPQGALSLSLYIWSKNSRSPTGQKVKPNMADMEALSYVSFSPPAQFLLYT